jgi:hypothetical protein
VIHRGVIRSSSTFRGSVNRHNYDTLLLVWKDACLNFQGKTFHRRSVFVRDDRDVWSATLNASLQKWN